MVPGEETQGKMPTKVAQKRQIPKLMATNTRAAWKVILEQEGHREAKTEPTKNPKKNEGQVDLAGLSKEKDYQLVPWPR